MGINAAGVRQVDDWHDSMQLKGKLVGSVSAYGDEWLVDFSADMLARKVPLNLNNTTQYVNSNSCVELK
jgi:hypothetical protein